MAFPLNKPKDVLSNMFYTYYSSDLFQLYSDGYNTGQVYLTIISFVILVGIPEWGKYKL